MKESDPSCHHAHKEKGNASHPPPPLFVLFLVILNSYPSTSRIFFTVLILKSEFMLRYTAAGSTFNVLAVFLIPFSLTSFLRISSICMLMILSITLAFVKINPWKKVGRIQTTRDTWRTIADSEVITRIFTKTLACGCWSQVLDQEVDRP